jgi:glycosyltransferase involved in cell wall biosynthesis
VKILFVNEGDSAGTQGQGRFDSIVRQCSVEHGWATPSFMTMKPMAGWNLRWASGVSGPLWRRDLDFQTARWHAAQALRVRTALARTLRSQRPDVIHMHPHTAAFALGGLTDLPPYLASVDSEIWEWRRMAIWQAVRPWSRMAMGSSLWRQRKALARAAAVVPWTEWAAAGVRRAAPTATVVVQHPGLDLAHFRPGPAERTGFRALFVGARFRAKGGYDLLEALAPWLDKGQAHLDIVTPDAIPELAGVTVHRLSGADPALLDLFRRASCLSLPSHGEAAPWVVLEAMACGLPVIASRVGAISEFVGSGATGILVDAGDVGALRLALASLINDRDYAEGLGAAARARCEERFDARSNTEALLQLARLVSGAPGPPGAASAVAESMRGLRREAR